MFDTRRHVPTGASYTATVALLAMALIFSPDVATICSALCIAIAWFDWNRNSALTLQPVVFHPVKTIR